MEKRYQHEQLLDLLINVLVYCILGRGCSKRCSSLGTIGIESVILRFFVSIFFCLFFVRWRLQASRRWFYVVPRQPFEIPPPYHFRHTRHWSTLALCRNLEIRQKEPFDRLIERINVRSLSSTLSGGRQCGWRSNATEKLLISWSPPPIRKHRRREGNRQLCEGWRVAGSMIRIIGSSFTSSSIRSACFLAGSSSEGS